MYSQLILHEHARIAAKSEAGEPAGDHARLIKEAWRQDPFKWARERLGIPLRKWGDYRRDLYKLHKWDGTPEPLHKAAKALAEGYNCGVTSATGIGKTFLGAILVFWFLDCWEGAQVITGAPKKEQLTLHIWKEIGKLWEHFQRLHPDAILDTLRIRMRPGRDDWGAKGFICGVGADEAVAERARGIHAEHLLFIVEETPGVHTAILNAFKFTCTAPHNLRLYFGNPDSEMDALAVVMKEPAIIGIRASSYDHPNIVANDHTIIPGATSKKSLDLWREEFGEENSLFMSRARGIPPAQASDALIRREWVERAMAFTDEERGAMMLKGHAALGVDCANSEAGDKGAYAYGRGPVVIEIKSEHTPDTNLWARQKVWPLIESGMVAAKRTGIDSVGVGAGAYNELRRLGGKAVQALNAGDGQWLMQGRAADQEEEFKNLRAQMWWQLRKDLQQGLISLPNSPELLRDICTPRWRTVNGTIRVEPKEDLKKRLGRSPDLGDAVMMWNWTRQFTKPGTFAGNASSGGPGDW